MKQIPLVRYNNMLQLWGRINGSVNIQFILDTGCSSMLLSKEVGDILFLKGNLVESDIKGSLSSSYGGVYTALQKEINIRNLTLGKIKLKDVSASICDRYGGPCLLGMSALDKLDGYSMTASRKRLSRQARWKIESLTRRGLKVLSSESGRFVKRAAWRIISLTMQSMS